MPRTVLIVDDDTEHCASIRRIVLNLGYSAVCVSSGADALSRMTDTNASAIDAIILDLIMPDLDGMAVLDRMRKARLSIPVIIQTTSAAIDCVESAIRAGASDFIVKPVGRERLGMVLENSLQRKSLEQELDCARRKLLFLNDIEDFLEINPSLKNNRSQYEKAACSDYPILIDGPLGVGKAMFAGALHGSSARRGKRFVSIDCKTTGFRSGISSIVEQFQFQRVAEGGTLFFRNVDCLSNSDQILLQNFLLEQGSSLSSRIKQQYRIMSSITGSAINAVKFGKLREDLFYKLSIFPITIPPFCIRPQDIEPSAIRITARLSTEMDLYIRSIGSDTIELLKSHPWHGNARELERAIFQAINICSGDRLKIDDFSMLLDANNASVRPRSDAIARDLVDLGSRSPNGEDLAFQNGMLGLLGHGGELRTLEQLEAMVLKFAFEHYGGCIAEIARYLGIGRSTLYRKLRLAGIIQPPEILTFRIEQAA